MNYPDDNNMRISRETICQCLCCLPKEELKTELMKGLRREKKEDFQDKPSIMISRELKKQKEELFCVAWKEIWRCVKTEAAHIGALAERTLSRSEKPLPRLFKEFQKKFKKH